MILKKHIVVVIIAVIVIMFTVRSCAAAEDPSFSGTFIQLTDITDAYSRQQWKELFDYMTTLDIKYIIIQWTVYGEMNYLKTPDFTIKHRKSIEYILEETSNRNIKVFLGLYSDDQFWERLKAPPEIVEVYLKRQYVNATKIADDLLPLISRYPSFWGWYISEEIDDVNWQTDYKQKILCNYLHELSKHLKKIMPTAKVGISGFTNAGTDPISLKELWENIFSNSSIDILFFQDGIGVNKLTFFELPIYLDAIKKAAETHNVHLSVIVEIMTMLKENPFTAEPAPISRILKQLTIASQFSNFGITAFSVPEYMTPLSGNKAQLLFEEYIRKCKKH
ncbi:conserved hypothetical protein, secreted [Candidatus Magnetobacterium bavaricum]|uniref:DUF4434 domain-containing protein n=1 Tax=Candidatus Magnetobacterium bavaricum TaxID=29290 RepID=A0A0F3GLS6_9BACT|nr:conserved hypothetical protein, secreted [Candidatus Magnetobacterium bavaricum]